MLGSIRLHDIKGAVVQADSELHLVRCTSKAPLIAEVCKQGGSWPALWDTVRHLGHRHTVGLKHLSRMLADHGRGPKNLALCVKNDSLVLPSRIMFSHLKIKNFNRHLSRLSLLTELYSGQRGHFCI